MNPADSRCILFDTTYKYTNPNGFNFMHKLFTESKNLDTTCLLKYFN